MGEGSVSLVAWTVKVVITPVVNLPMICPHGAMPIVTKYLCEIFSNQYFKIIQLLEFNCRNMHYCINYRILESMFKYNR